MHFIKDWHGWRWAVAVVLLLLTLWPVIEDPRTRQLLANTLLLVGSVVVLSLAIGVPLAMLLTRTDLWGRKPAFFCLSCLMFLPLYVQAAAWQAGFGIQGWFTFLARQQLLVGMPAVIWIHTASAIPWVVIITSLGLRWAEPELEELALLEMSPWAVLMRVTRRRAAPAITIAALWVAVLTAGDMTVTNLFLVRTYAEEVYTQFSQGTDLGETTIGLLPGILGTVWLLFAGLIMTGNLASHGRHPSQQRSLRFHLGALRIPCSMIVWAAIGFLAGVPLGNLIYKAGWLATRTAEGWQRWWSVERVFRVIGTAPVRFGREFAATLLIAAIAAGMAVVVATLLAWIAQSRGWRGVLSWLITASCLALPGPILGLGIICLFQLSNQPWVAYLYDRTIAPPVLAQWIRALPLATIVLWQAFATVPREWIDAAAVDGARPTTILFSIVVRTRIQAVLAAALVAFAVAAGDLAATILVVPPGMTTLPIQIFNLIHGGVDDLVAGVCLVLIALYAVIAGAVWWLISRSNPLD